MRRIISSPTPNLTPRLELVSDMIRRGGFIPEKTIIADVGTDHAKLPIYLIINKICCFAYACDLREKPLQKAEENINRFLNNEDLKKIKTILSDGTEKIPRDYNILTITGMGGELISDILQKNPPDEDVSLILSPMTAAENLRKYLYDNSYDIVEERLAKEESKIYTVMRAIKKKTKIEYNFMDTLLSKSLFSCNSNELINIYIEIIIKRQVKIIEGRNKAGKLDAEYFNAVELKGQLEALIK